jgi:hypothetical protein
MVKRTLNNPQGLPEIYAKRQPKRPHYLRDWIERRGFRTDTEFAEAIGADKSVVSRWLDEDDPTTPGKDWQVKLGTFFGDEDDPADIFRHPDDDWFTKFFRTRSEDQIRRAREMLEIGFPPEDDVKKHSNRS